MSDELKPEDIEVGRKAVEDALIEMRDARISLLGRGNGLVIRERDGKDSDIIRLSVADAIRIAFKAMARRPASEQEQARERYVTMLELALDRHCADKSALDFVAIKNERARLASLTAKGTKEGK